MKKTFYAKVARIIAIFILLLFCSISNVYADDFEASIGGGLGWTNYGLGVGMGMSVLVGYTSGTITTTPFYEYDEYGRRFARYSMKKKEVDIFDFDILLDLHAGYPFCQGGGIFNLYFFVPDDFFALGVGLGGGYAIAYDYDEPFMHAPYIRVALPVLLSMINLNVKFDFYFFEKQTLQIGAYFNFFL